MALETHKYTTIPRDVLAVRVNSQNMREVAAWCGGVIQSTKPDGSRGPRHIKLEIPSARDERQKRAYAGDWVLRNDKGFRFFLDKAFRANFVQVDGVDSVFHETGIPAKKAAKKKKAERKPRPVNPVMAAAMKAAQEKLGAQEIVQGPHGTFPTVAPAFSDVVKKDVEIANAKIVDNAELYSVNMVMDPPHPDWKVESVDGVEARTVENSLDRLTGEPATVYTPPEDLVPVGTEITPGGEIMNENQGERQDPAEVKKVDTATETAPQDPPAEPAPENPTINTPEAEPSSTPSVEVTPEAPTQG